jgi:hypothetical protein
MKSDARIWEIAADLIVQEGAAAEGQAAKLANLMLDHGDPERQIEWLRVRTAIVLLREPPADAISWR